MEELDLKELFEMFLVKKTVIFLIVLISLFIGVFYSYFLVEPKYLSSTKIVLSKNEQQNPLGITTGDLALNSQLLANYRELLESKAVLGQVVDNLPELKLNEDILRENVKIEVLDESEFIKITVEDKDPNNSATIANEIARVFKEKAIEIFEIKNVKILEDAEPSSTPYNVNHVKDLIIFGFVGFILACGYVFVMNMFDVTIKGEDDIEKISGLLVLAAIPNYELDTDKKSKGGRR